MVGKKRIINDCKILLEAYKQGLLGDTNMPEDSHPSFKNYEERLAYFTLPMALNYQRDSYSLWKSALKAYQDIDTRDIFNIKKVTKMSEDKLRGKLIKHKVALQPNKHIDTWYRISKAFCNWKSIENFFETNENDFLIIKKIIQSDNKKDFPYLSGPKIFNYWSFIISAYGGIKLKNKEYIEIAPDTHIIKCSVKLGVITEQESNKLNRNQISARWREILKGSGITPIEMHQPLWFWSKNTFKYQLPDT